MNYYDAMLISCALALFVLVLMRMREMVTAKFIAELDREDQAREKAAKEANEKAIPENVMAIFSDGGRTFDGWVKLEDLNKLKRIYVAANQLMACNEDNTVQLFAKLERAVNS